MTKAKMIKFICIENEEIIMAIKIAKIIITIMLKHIMLISKTKLREKKLKKKTNNETIVVVDASL